MPVETFGTAYEVFAAKDARGADLPYGPGRVRAEDAGAAETTELRLPTERTIAGRVVDAAGGPLPALEVSAFPVPANAGLEVPVGAMPNAHGTAKTDADGRFLLGRLGTGLYRIQVEVGPGSASPAIPEVAAGTTDIVLRVPLAVEARIIVLDPDGAPVPEASVTASAPGPMYGGLGPGPDPAGSRRSVANEHGVAFVTGLEADREYSLVASPPPARTDLRWTNGPKGWKPHDDTIRLLRDHVVRGAVHDAAGRPQPGVVLRRLDDGTWKPAGGALPDGSFTLRMLDPGTIVVAAAKDWRSTRGPEVTATVDGEPVVLVLPP